MELFLRVVLVILWLPVDWLSSQKIEQNPQALSIQEGEEAILTCSYANYFPTSFQWFREDPERGLTFLLLIRENERTKSTRRLKATFDNTNKQSLFYITNSQPADSATYFCASDTQQDPAIHFLHPNPANHACQQSCWLCCPLRAYCSSTGRMLYHWENNVVVI